jgi:phage terminase small subunit
MKAFVVEFGLTPLSRTRLTIGRRQDAEDERSYHLLRNMPV